MADSEKLGRLVSEFGRVSERRKLRVIVSKSKAMCSGHGNGGRMHERLNGEPFEGVNCFKYVADGGSERDVVHRMNEGYIAWLALKIVLNNRGLGINVKKCLYEGVIVPTILCKAEEWGLRSAERRKVNDLEM